MSCKRHHLRRGGSGQWSRISRRLAPSSPSSGSGRPQRRQADPSPADHKPASGSPIRSTKPPHTYLSSPASSMEETATQRQRARGRESHTAKTTQSPCRQRRGTPTGPSTVHEAPARESRTRGDQKAVCAVAAPIETPPPATVLHALFTARQHRSGVPTSFRRCNGRRRRREPPAAPGKRGEN